MDEIGLSQNAQHRQHGAEDKENEDQHNGAALFLRHEPVAQTHQMFTPHQVKVFYY